MAVIKPPTQITGEILFYVTSILCIFIITPILIYFTFRFNQYKNTIVVRKRYPNIIIIILTLLIINICIRIPLTILIVTPTNLFITILRSDVTIFIESFLNIYLTHAVIILIALRFWMIFYKLNYAYSSSTSEWKTVINPLISTNNWFLQPKNKSTFGNAKSMFCRYFLPFYIIYGTIDFFLLSANRWSILFEFHLSYFQLIDSLYYLLVMIFCVYLYKQTPNWNDHCYIRQEMKLASLLWLICLIVFIINSIIFLIFELISYKKYNINTNEYIQSIITIYISLIFFTLNGLILTAYPINKISIKPSDLTRASSPDQIEMIIRKNNININKTNNNHTKSVRCRALSEPTHNISIINKPKKNTNKVLKNGAIHSKDDEIITILHSKHSFQESDSKQSEIKNLFGTNEYDLNRILSDVLSSSILFDRFMNYLSRSFSTESLLSFIEFYQFKQFIILQFENELILNDNNKLFISRLKYKLQHKKLHKNDIKKLRNGNNNHVINNLFNVLLPDSLPKSFLVYGDFISKQINNGKSVKKSMSKLEKSASKFGYKLYQKEVEKQKKLNKTIPEELSKTPSKVLNSEISDPSEKSKSDKSKSDRLHTTQKTEKLKKSNSGRSSIKPRYPLNIRKESATVHSQTEYTTFAGSYNSVRLQIPESQYTQQYVREDDGKNSIYIHTSMESVTEKDIYDDIKVGTPSMASQTIPHVDVDISTIGIPYIEESATTTYINRDYINKHLTGGVSVEVDEHLDKNREISVTPQPSQTSVVTSITNLGHNHPSTIFVRNLSHTNTITKSKYYKKSDRRNNTPITPYGSRQRFGSATATVTNLSVSMDEKEIQDIQRIKDVSPKSKSGTKSEKIRNLNSPNTPNTPSTVVKGVGFGDMPMDMDEAKKKIRIIAHKLYMKYLNIGAEFEINIPHRIRKKLIKMKLDNLDAWLEEIQANINELYNLFDDCMEEMFALMRSSITVFLDSQNYQQ